MTPTPLPRAVVAVTLLMLAGCAGKPVGPATGGGPQSWPDVDGRPSGYTIDLASIPDAVPRPEPRAERGNPPFYQVDGRRYFVMESADGHVERGIASWYGTKFHGRTTSSGEPYDMFAMTAAHPSLPLPTYVQVTNLQNGKSVVVRVNDRGPFLHNRVIDLSYAAASRLDIVGAGTGLVEVRALDPGAVAAAAVVQAPAVSPRLFVQIGAFASRENAERVAERLRAADIYNVELSPRADVQPQLWRVRVGPLEDVDEVDAVSARVMDSGFPEARVVID